MPMVMATAPDRARRVGGRPRGEYRVLVLDALADGAELTSRQIAAATRIAHAIVTTTTSNMVKAGELCKVRRVRVPGVCRPVPVYAIAAAVTAPGSGHDGAMLTLQSAMASMVSAARRGHG